MSDEPTPEDLETVRAHLAIAREIAAVIRAADWGGSEGVAILALAIGCYLADDPSVILEDAEDKAAFDSIVDAAPRGIRIAFDHHRKLRQFHASRRKHDGSG